MYKNKFLAIIKKDGKPVRELAGTYVGLPFNTEYEIELRNDNYQRAVAQVYIDGMEAITDGVVIEGRSSVTLERFVLDGNLSKGKKFKFVPIDSAPEADPSNSKNGVVEIKFTLEKQVVVAARPPLVYSGSAYLDFAPSTNPTITFYPDSVTSASYTKGMTDNNTSATLSVNDSAVFTCYASSAPTIRSMNVAGVTAEGSVSNQKFKNVTVGDLDLTTETTITLFLKGIMEEVGDKIYCTKCGKKTKPSHSFCPHCGARIELE